MEITKKIPRILIASPSSAAGKTTVTCAILSALRRRANEGEKCSPIAFKCGPDFIDPLFHRAAGAESANLDGFFLSSEKIRALFSQYTADIAVIEGAMGFYDGLCVDSDRASSYDIARTLDCPVILAVDSAKSARSIAALLAGFSRWKSDSRVIGVILNNITEERAAELKTVIENEVGLSVFGFLKKDARFSIESRYLGLSVPSENSAIAEKMAILADSAEKTIDIDAIIAAAKNAPMLSVPAEPIFPVQKNTPSVKIAVAKDEAFCFYYRENLDLLRAFGAQIITFSPLHDKKLPNGIDALYLGGGYPELFPDALFENTTLCESIRGSIRGGLPVLAECGGFLYLQALGVLKGTFCNTGKLCRFGYATVRAEKDTLLCTAGEEIKAHEFHYFDTSENGTACTAEKPSGKKWACVISDQFDETPALPPFSQTLNVWAGFPHLYFLSNPDFAKNFVEAAARFQKMRSVLRTKCSVCPKKHRKSISAGDFSR